MSVMVVRMVRMMSALAASGEVRQAIREVVGGHHLRSKTPRQVSGTGKASYGATYVC
jgi:hypothetical protein